MLLVLAFRSCGISRHYGIVSPMFRIFTLLLVGLLAALSACTTLSREECSSGDWRKIGIQDGNDGRPAERFDRHVKACGREGSLSGREQYMAGRESGLATYCTMLRGYREGALGQNYYDVCPPLSVNQFQTGFQLGTRIRQMESRISDVNEAYYSTSRRLEQKSLPEAERTRLIQEQASLQADEARMNEDLKVLKTEADALVAASRKQN